ncbi:hypothetical protein LCGC14_1741250 [marine sediment metagenome]|uniref:Phage ABA sandwich domain-containing protein n=1 Tax=marine sediment metagenome TaxID=412755 RepID=A0A0F9JLT9_9ZZZZ
MTDLKSLIAELEQAKEGSNELDRQIHAFVDGSPLEGSCDKCKQTFIRFPRSYTVNLDDALKLVPEGWEWGIGSGWSHKSAARLPIAQLVYLDMSTGKQTTITENGNTPAIALCIAALKALEDG